MQRFWKAGISIGIAAISAALCIMTTKGRALEAPKVALEPDSSNVVTHTAFLPLAFSRFDPSLGTPPFGVQMYGPLDASTGITYAVDVGASWVRANIFWSTIEPTDRQPEQYNWSSPDAVIVDPALRGLNLLVTIRNAPDWAATYTNGPIDKVDIGEFAEFVGSLVERYDGDGLDDAPGSPIVNHWEFYNEPDAGDEFRASTGHSAYWGHFGDQYAAMLETVYPVIKEANPNANVVFGGIAYDWFEDEGGPFVEEFLDDVLAAGGGQFFDIMNIHAYSGFTDDSEPENPGLRKKVEYIRAKMQSHGVDKPIIVSETGKHSNDLPDHPSSPELQARYVVVLFTQGIASDTKIVIWWMLKEPGSYFWDNGLLDYDLDPKPSYHAFQTIVSELGTAHFERALTVTETGTSAMEAYVFTDNVYERPTYVAWLYPLETSDESPLRLPAFQATVRDIYGSAYTVLDGDDGVHDGQVTIPVSGQPVYVEIAY
jgi:hypothetical protein